ncbi:MAG: hypothetical protein A2418_03265 [Candidatus Brennerbacteria bacterium RIFOXYC1_FULL_41_11]|nr:MAG: hypothetical protein A2391_00945 [Candidatus Brennerbacteria bacterium RIFOXYB1_FULL_41_13]OGY40097.1 MAG: hypothetical protein A2418_03265 [Candidatus Brennerbacteria bacterium RIFOXYC1_FULL_41_11]
MENKNKKGRDLLLELERTGQYVFHGSEDGEIEVFEPRQAFNFIGGKKVEDDKPGVHATPVVAVAIFMALFNGKNCPQGFSSSFVWDKNKHKVIFSATKQGIDQLKMGDASGYVYIFDKGLFQWRKHIEYISYNVAKPIKKIKVDFSDLPEDIKIISDFGK